MLGWERGESRCHRRTPVRPPRWARSRSRGDRPRQMPVRWRRLALRAQESFDGESELGACLSEYRSRVYRFRSAAQRSEEHTSELEPPVHLVCRLLLEKKKTENNIRWTSIE